MQFLVTAHDGTDSQAQARRQKARPEHIALGDRMKGEGRYLFGAAILDEAGQMIGSTMIMEFPDRAGLDGWLKAEPYVTGDVWKQIDIKPCRVGPSFTR